MPPTWAVWLPRNTWSTTSGLWSVLALALSLAATVHIVLTKRQTRAAIAWVGVVWIAPLGGVLAYVLLGINRIRRKARQLRRRMRRSGPSIDAICTPTELRAELGPEGAYLLGLNRLVTVITRQPLMEANEIVPLRDGSEAYPAMLEAIESARRSISLATYIFYDDPTGRQFVDALGRAVARGVEVRVLIDDVGARYGWPWIRPVRRALRAAGVPTATFLPTFTPSRLLHFNMRNHRKVLVVDGGTAFTGGMNIDHTFAGSDGPGPQHHDLHFRVRGPVVAELQRVFVDDWDFTTGERLDGPLWFAPAERIGSTPARCVADGPDEYHDRLLLTILGAVSTAQRSIQIITPYFLPDEPLLTALSVAALRGIEVEIVLPSAPNIGLVGWAAMPGLEQLLEVGCRVHRTPPPFDHAKLMVIDGAWTFIGSANLDPRSLRLNFELNLECYGPAAAGAVLPQIERRRQRAHPLSLADLQARPWLVRVRDGVARLFSPYL